MRKIINGKLYNTDTARLVGNYRYGYPRDFEYWEEALYQKQNGEYFLCGEGGPMSCYAVHCGNESSGSSAITPMTVKEAKEWVEHYSTVETYIKEFGEPEE